MDETIYKRSSKGKRLQKTAIRPVKLKFKNRTVDVTKTVRIGRGSHNDIVLDTDSLVSRNHAVIERSEGFCTIIDLGSTNCTYVNGNPLKEKKAKKLKAGDIIKVGNTEFQFLG